MRMMVRCRFRLPVTRMFKVNWWEIFGMPLVEAWYSQIIVKCLLPGYKKAPWTHTHNKIVKNNRWRLFWIYRNITILYHVYLNSLEVEGLLLSLFRISGSSKIKCYIALWSGYRVLYRIQISTSFLSFSINIHRGCWEIDIKQSFG